MRLRICCAAAVAGLLAAGSPAAAGVPARPSPRPVTATAAAPSTPIGVVERVCEALHALPQQRKSECCARPAASSLAPLCVQELKAALGRATVSIDAAAAERCIAAASAQVEGCDWVTPLHPARPTACDGLIQGQRKAGAACLSSLECGDALYCRGAQPGGSGICAPALPAGARCENPADTLAAFTGFKDDPHHAECQGRCVKGVCLALIPKGSQCSSQSLCAEGLNCIGGRCADQPLPLPGEACGASACQGGATCVNARCVAPQPQGASCTQPFECRSLHCVLPAGAKPGSLGVCADACESVAVTPRR